MEKDTGVDIRPKNLPSTPQWENDFFNNLIILATSIGLVLRTSRWFIPTFGSSGGGWSSKFGTVDFDAKKLLNRLLLSNSRLSAEGLGVDFTFAMEQEQEQE